MGVISTILGVFGITKAEQKPRREYGVHLIKQFEGFKANPYICPAGKWTRGYGSTILAGNVPVNKNTAPVDEITAENDVYWYCDNKIVPVLKKKGCYDRLNYNQKSAVMSFCFNVGENAFACSTMCKIMANDPYDPKIPNEFLKWDKYTNPKTGKKEALRGLTIRRAAEAELYQS